MKIINPYEGIEFGTAQRVNSITHEHIFDSEKLKAAYDRGIRHFCNLHYLPAVPRYPISNFYYKVVDGVPSPWLYKDWADPANNDFTLVDTAFIGTIADFEDINGNLIHVDDIPQIPNAEHTHFIRQTINGVNSPYPHFSTPGSLLPDAGNGNGIAIEYRNQYPTMPKEQIHDFCANENLLFENKVFGTINHCSEVNLIIEMFRDYAPLFKAMELSNTTSGKENSKLFRRAYDVVLSKGYRLWGVSVQDWQNSNAADWGIYYDFGCNVLYVPDNYGSLPANDFLTIDGKKYTNKHSPVYTKAEAGLDAYIAGKFYASGFGRQKITSLNVNGNVVYFEVDGNPSEICAITNQGIIKGSGNSLSVSIKEGDIFLRFEAYYYNDDPIDFIFTQPIFVEDNEDSSEQLLLLLD